MADVITLFVFIITSGISRLGIGMAYHAMRDGFSKET